MPKELATVAGRGRKHCPGCNKYPGVRSKICPGCGHEFGEKKSAKLKIKVRTSSAPEIATPTPTPEPAKTPAPRPSRVSRILIPAGKPPVKLEGTSIEQVREWMAATRETETDGYLTHEALCYWVRYFYPYYSPDENGKIVRNNTGDVVRAIIRKLDGVEDEVRMGESEGFEE